MKTDLACFIPYADFSSAGRAALSYLQQLIGLECWLLNRVEEGEGRVLALQGAYAGIAEGNRSPFADAICARMIACGGPQAAADLLHHPELSKAPLVAALGVRAYLGAPILNPDGSVYGTLCAIDSRPQSDLVATALPLVACVARLLATLLVADQRALTQTELALWAEEAEAQLQDYTDQLMGRVRELACLYEIDQLGRRETLTIEQLLERALPLLLEAWSRPEQIAIEILYNQSKFSSEGFSVSDCCLRAPLWLDRRRIGTIRVCYRAGCHDNAGGCFAEEERALLASVAIRLSDMLQRRHDEEVLRDQRWRLQSIIEGTHVGTWEWNVQSGALRVNELWAGIVGYRLEELEPVSIATWEQLVHPDDYERSNTELARHFLGETEYYDLELRMRHREGFWVWVHDRGKVCSRDDQGRALMMFGTHQDISARKAMEAQLRASEERFAELSRRDGLTGLLNRRGWNESVQAEECRAQRYGHPACVLIADLDGLKKVNDEQGHKAGDHLIVRAAKALQSSVRDVDRVARIGGDEFAVLAIECDPEHQQLLLERMAKALKAAGVKVSWGMAESLTCEQLSEAVAEADRRMYAMKAEHHRQQRLCH